MIGSIVYATWFLIRSSRQFAYLAEARKRPQWTPSESHTGIVERPSPKPIGVILIEDATSARLIILTGGQPVDTVGKA